MDWPYDYEIEDEGYEPGIPWVPERPREELLRPRKARAP